jgi:sterol desaturase/sphingolipid hydroxylase (fatty acid hydroxylase superfamily)
LRKRIAANRYHLGPNLTLTFITFATNLVMNAALVLALAWVQAAGFGLLNRVHVPLLWQIAIVLIVLDFAFYVAHVSMHKLPAFWRFHAVHHSDPAVDVTTNIRQHPGEGLIRYGFIALFALPLGASVPAFAVYRLASALNGLFEHANIRLPQPVDTALSLLTTWPNMHKLHHSRDARFTDTNYGNLFSIWDRLFGTFTPSHLGADVAYGLPATDNRAQQTTTALLAMPFRERTHAQTAHSGAVGSD